MQLKTSTVIWIFIWSLFMGVTAISIGVGALFPPLNYIASPVVCPGGQMSVNSTVYNPYPVTTVTTEDWICTNSRTGEQTGLSIFQISLVAGLVYGLLLFVLIMVLRPLLSRMMASRTSRSYESVVTSFEQEHQADIQQAAATDDQELAQLRQLERQEQAGSGASGEAASGSSARRLKELERLRAGKLITQAEYDKKRADILSSL